jgi:putative methyltransferase (TIGR04325 family)
MRSVARRFKLRYCRGVYRTYQEALAAVPSGRLVGYDNEEASRLYLGEPDLVKPTDYAIFYWLAPLLRQYGALFDFGGNIGRLYFPFRKYLTYPPGMRWMICDVPAVVELGRSVARERGESQLEFTTDLARAEEFDVFFTSGTLQFVEHDLAYLLSGMSNRPRHLLINRVPMSDRPACFTVHDNGPARHPYYIANRTEFVESLQRLGYVLVDSWRCPESSCRILFHHSRRLRSYTGMYLRREA